MTADGDKTPKRRVLLFSPLPGRDPASGDTSYTEALLACPPSGVTYTTYDEAIRDGSVKVRGRKPTRGSFGAIDLVIFGFRAIELAVRKSTLGFREPIWYVSINANKFDLVHQHLFCLRQVGSRIPVVSGAGYPLTELYAYREGWGQIHLRIAQKIESLIATALDVHEPWLRPTRGSMMVVYTEQFRDWLIVRGVAPSQVRVAGTAVPEFELPALSSDGRTLGIVARDFERKGGDVALAAYRELRESDSRWRLIVATTSEQAQKHQISGPGIELVCDASRALVLDSLLPRIDVLLAPTRSDCGTPFAFLEALQLHTCIVTSDGPWLDPRLSWPAVARVPVDAHLVASAANGFITGDLHGAQLAAHELWRREFSMDKLCASLSNAYETVLEWSRSPEQP